jgi:hypothetical protein
MALGPAFAKAGAMPCTCQPGDTKIKGELGMHHGSDAAAGARDDDDLAGQEQLGPGRIDGGIHILIDIPSKLEAMIC